MISESCSNFTTPVGLQFGICLEASNQRGMGHLFRGIALAQSLENISISVKFFVNDFSPALEILTGKGYVTEVVNLEDFQSDWEQSIIARHQLSLWVNDRHFTEFIHSERIKRAGIPLVCIEDGGPGALLADLNVFAMTNSAISQDFTGATLSGLKYLILNNEVKNYRFKRTKSEKIVVSMGGSDTYGVSSRVVEELWARRIPATIIIGPGSIWSDSHDLKFDSSFIFKRNVSSLPAEFSRHDIAITSGGLTPFEANAAGLPAIIIATEPWEIEAGHLLSRLGGSYFAGYRNAIDFSFLDRSLDIGKMSEAALKSVPSAGADNTAAEIVSVFFKFKRPCR